MRRLSEVLAITLALLAGLASGGVTAESGPSAMGYWEGSIEYPGAPMKITLMLLQNRTGEWSGVIGIPSQGIRDLGFNTIDIEGGALSFGVIGINGDPMFTGEITADGQAISGTLSQSGQSFPFSLRRSTEQPVFDPKLLEPYEKEGVPGEGLAGTWFGLMEKPPARIRVVMTIARGEDGTLSGTMRSPDQGDEEVPIDSLSFEGTAVNMTVGSLYATYQAEMNGDGSTMLGTWNQTGRTMTLEFKRQAESGK